MRRRWAAVLAPFALIIAGGADAQAAPASPAYPVHLRYAAPASCPSESDFVADLRRDTDPFELTGEGGAQRRVDVELEVLTTSARGRFRLVDAGEHGTTIQRELTGPDCAAVERALALMVALTMKRLSAPPPPPQVATDPEPAPPRAPVPPPPVIAPPPPPASVRAPRSVRISVDLEGGLTSAVVDSALPFVALALQVEPRVQELRPAFAISVRQSLPKEVSIAGGEASFLWTAGALRVCPHVIALASFDLAPCIEASLGRLHADAKGLPAPRSSTDLWTDGSLVLAGRWHFSSRAYLTTSASVTAAFNRSRFALSSGVLISETPAVGIGGGVGVGLTF